MSQSPGCDHGCSCDADGNLISTTNGSSQTTTYSYNADLELMKTVEAGSVATSYGYDPGGSAISVGMMSGYLQNTGSSVYKPPGTGRGRRLPRSQLGPGSEPCNNPTRVVAKRVARFLGPIANGDLTSKGIGVILGS